MLVPSSSIAKPELGAIVALVPNTTQVRSRLFGLFRVSGPTVAEGWQHRNTCGLTWSSAAGGYSARKISSVFAVDFTVTSPPNTPVAYHIGPGSPKPYQPVVEIS